MVTRNKTKKKYTLCVNMSQSEDAREAHHRYSIMYMQPSGMPPPAVRQNYLMNAAADETTRLMDEGTLSVVSDGVIMRFSDQAPDVEVALQTQPSREMASIYYGDDNNWSKRSGFRDNTFARSVQQASFYDTLQEHHIPPLVSEKLMQHEVRYDKYQPPDMRQTLHENTPTLPYDLLVPVDTTLNNSYYRWLRDNGMETIGDGW